ncbi:unnamed protein product [Fusarium graminearum]|nr:unnamed protein product [Fusarium graminearum]
MPGWPWYSTDLCTIVLPSTVEVIVSESVVGGDWKRTTVSGATANAIGLPIRWHSSDFASTTAGTTTSATDSGTETIKYSTSTSSNDPSSSNTGLSTGPRQELGLALELQLLLDLLRWDGLCFERGELSRQVPPQLHKSLKHLRCSSNSTHGSLIVTRPCPRRSYHRTIYPKPVRWN